MNIDRIGQKAIEAYLQRTPGTSEKAGQSTARDVSKSEQDEVSISKAARELQEAQKAVQNAHDVRHDKVAEIKRQIEGGTYKVSTEIIVEKLLTVLGNG